MSVRPETAMKGVFGLGCLALLCWAAFWITAIVIALHFILKAW